jgi:hypothetical protein
MGDMLAAALTRVFLLSASGRGWRMDGRERRGTVSRRFSFLVSFLLPLLRLLRAGRWLGFGWFGCWRGEGRKGREVWFGRRNGMKEGVFRFRFANLDGWRCDGHRFLHNLVVGGESRIG